MTTHPTNDWPEGVIARYLTVAGTALGRADLAVDIETLNTVDGPYSTRSTCSGCLAQDEWNYGLYRNYRDESGRVKGSQDDARAWAQSHAETCRAMPRPTSP